MTAKKRTDEEQTTEINTDPFAYDMSKVTEGFSLGALLANFKDKSGESAQRKFSIGERIANAYKNIARIQSMIANLEIKAQTESGQVFVNQVVKPIVEEMRNIFPNAKVDVFGPFGLSGQATITVGRKVEGQAAKGKTSDSRSITLVPANEEVAIRDYSRSSDQYAPGSPEYLSGLNHPTVSVPPESAMEFIVNWLMK